MNDTNINLAIAAVFVEEISRRPESLFKEKLLKRSSYSMWAIPFIKGDNVIKSVYFKMRVGHIKRHWRVYDSGPYRYKPMRCSAAS